MATPHTQGAIEPLGYAVEVEEIVTDDVVKFKVRNAIFDGTLSWLTTAFVTDSGVEVCDKVENLAVGEYAGHIYEAKCFDGYAYVDIFASASSFDFESANTELIPGQCKGGPGDSVARFTFVFTCNCDEIPNVPNEIVGTPEPNPMMCSGPVGTVAGDPHLWTYDGKPWSA